MCDTVAEEVEVIAEEDTTQDDEYTADEAHSSGDCAQDTANENEEQSKDKSHFPEDYKPPVIPVQKNSESYNGAVKEQYSWAQTIMELGMA